MSSPVGECDVCGEMMYEGEWNITGKIMHHETCNPKKKPWLKKKIEVAEKLQDDLLKFGIKSIVDMTRGELVINIADNLNYGKRNTGKN